MGLVRRSPASRRDYLTIWSHIARDNAEAADHLVRTFDQKVQLLSESPHAGRARSELRPRLRSFPVGSYTLFYRPIRGGIQLVRIVHGARDLGQIFKKR